MTEGGTPSPGSSAPEGFSGGISPEWKAAVESAFFLVGPTAVGKTELALALAREFDGEIVGADALQVYRGLDLLTAKPPAEALAATPHHLIGTVPLSETFNVARYLEAALPVIAEIRARGRLPIVAGGTGLYLRALTRGLAEIPPSDPGLREELGSTPLPLLLERLEALDPVAAATIDRQNPRRVVRALEVSILTGKPFSAFRGEWERPAAFHGVLLVREREDLYERIDRRAEAMFEQGVVEEVRAQIEAGGVGPTAQQAIGWREIGALIRGEIGRAQCLDAIRQITRRYAKRQLTWFRREPMLTPVSLNAANDISSIFRRIAAAVPVGPIGPIGSFGPLAPGSPAFPPDSYRSPHRP